jgi:nucleoside-diphosphate-sugar epimerase
MKCSNAARVAGWGKPMRRLVVLGGGTPLGRRVVAALRENAEVDCAVGIERHRFNDPAMNDGLEFISWSSDHRPFAEYLLKEEIDTVIDCGLVADRGGAETRPSGADVISAMYVGAAISDERSFVRSWVLASSSALYSSQSYMPLLLREEYALSTLSNDRATSIAEAEEYARSLAKRLPHVNVAIMRLQELAGPDCRGPLAALLARPLVPRIPGFDPTIQLLHADDAVSALSWAAKVELAGIYNVSSVGMLRWSDAIRLIDHRSFPLLPVPLPLVEPLLENMGIPFVYSSMFDLLRYGQAIDIEKLAQAGWCPKNAQLECLSGLV